MALKICLLLFVCITLNAQEFKFIPDGLTDYVVTEVDIKQAELYLKTKDWVKDTYSDPSEVLKADFENEKIRIEGITPDAYCVDGFCSDAMYQIEISFKDGKYKFDPISLKFRNATRINEIPINNGSAYFKKSGEVRSSLKDAPTSFENIFNSLNKSLKNYINAGSEDNDW